MEKKTPPVVRTWGDLFDQPILTLADGNQVRLGLEATEVPRNSSFLVYALLNGTRWEPKGERSLGPLQVEMIRRNGKRGEEKARLKDLGKFGMDVVKAKHLLFAATVTTGRAGIYQLDFKGPDDTIVASATISVMQKEGPGWLAFGFPMRDQEEAIKKLRDDKEDKVRAPVSLQDRTWAVPVCRGDYPFLTRPDGPREIPLTKLLPRWVYDHPDFRLHLKADEKVLYVESEIDLLLSNPREHWLCRLWVNGQPYSRGEVGVENRKALEALKRRVALGKKLHLDWDFDPAVFGTRKGDRVAVQLVFCPFGWQEVADWDRRDRFKKEAVPKARFQGPLVTPKAEFIVR